MAFHIKESSLPTCIVQQSDNLQQILVIGHIWIIDLFNKWANVDQGDCLEVRSHGEFGWHTDTTEGSGLARRLEGETDIMVDLVGEEGGWSHDTMDRIGHISTGIQWFGRWVAAYLYQDHNLGF